MKRAKTPVESPAAAALEEALARYRALLPANEFRLLLEELERPLYPAIRTNPLKAAPGDLQDWSQRYGWSLRGVPYCPTGWWITEGQTSPGGTLEHRLGAYYIQDAASMLPVELFDLEAGGAPLILDLAASPGGKTTHLVSRSGDQGLVIANDSSAERITALRLVLQTWGAVNTAVTRFGGENFGPWFPDVFDYVLLDAPCSMENLRSSEARPMRPISARERQNLARRQQRLLTSALQAARQGGQVVYATCTLNPEENEAVLDAILRRYPGAFQVTDISSRLPAAAPALNSDGSLRFDPAVQKAARLWPHRFGTSGFFAALLTRLGPLDLTSQPPPARPFDRCGLSALRRREAQSLSEDLFQVYGLDLDETLQRQDLSLWQRRAAVYAIPNAFFERFSTLPFQTLGLLVGEKSDEGFSLSHEWTARFARQLKRGKVELSNAQTTAWLRGEDLRGFSPPGYAPGAIVIMVDEEGRFLGRGRVQASRLKNLLPRRLALFT